MHTSTNWHYGIDNDIPDRAGFMQEFGILNIPVRKIENYMDLQ
jgi:hypothetical protein